MHVGDERKARNYLLSSKRETLLGKGWNLFVPDLPGFGRTPPLQEPDISALAGALSDLIAQIEGDDGSVIIVAHSLGGEVATHIAQRQPRWLETFVNVEGNIDLSNTTVDRAVAETDDFDRWFDVFADGLYRHGVAVWFDRDLRQLPMLCGAERARTAVPLVA